MVRKGGVLAMNRAVPQVPVAVIGCGYWGKNLVRNFAELGVLAAIADPDQGTAAKLSERFDTKVRSADQVLDDRSIAAVAIAAPAAHHASLARAALEAGKHVFVEKPLALTLVEAERLCQLAEQRDRRLMVGHLLQYHPAFIALRDLVRRGALGRLQYLYSNRLNLGKVRREEDILWSFAPHDMSMILSLVGRGAERGQATGGAIICTGRSPTSRRRIWRFPAASRRTSSCPGCTRSRSRSSSWSATARWPCSMTACHGVKSCCSIRTASTGARRCRCRSAPRPTAVALDEGEPLEFECRHFLDCVATGARPRTDGQEGLRVLRVLTRASESLKSRRRAARHRPSRPPFPGVQIHPSAFVDEPCEIGAGTRIWHFAHILPRTRIGRDCSFGQNVMVGPDVTVGDGCKIQNNVSIYKGVTLEDGVFCGPSCVFTNVNNPRAEVERKDEFRPTLVKRGATIGANATIVCGHTIGEYAFIAAGAVVTQDVPAFALMAGVPARRIGWMSHAGERLGPDLVCPRSGRRYREAGPDRIEEIG